MTLSLTQMFVFIDLEMIVPRNRDLFVDHFDALVIFQRVYQIKSNMGWINITMTS